MAGATIKHPVRIQAMVTSWSAACRRNRCRFPFGAVGNEASALVVGDRVPSVGRTGAEPDAGRAIGECALDGDGEEMLAEAATVERRNEAEILDLNPGLGGFRVKLGVAGRCAADLQHKRGD